MSSSEGFTPQNKPWGANRPYLIDEQTETQRTHAAGMAGAQSELRSQSPVPWGHWKLDPSCPEKAPLQRRNQPWVSPKGGLYGLELFFRDPRLWGLVEPWSPSSTVLDP